MNNIKQKVQSYINHNSENEKRIKQSGFIWNIFSSVITALSSVLVLLVIKRFIGMEAGAVFSIAVAITNVLINVGNMNVIGYQISDVLETFSFQTYLRLRRLTVAIMLLCSLGYIIVKSYTLNKSFVVLLYCIYKAINAYCDVYQGRYQQKGRVDIASKMQFFKVLIPDTVLCIAAIFTKNLMLSVGLAVVVEFLFMQVFNWLIFEQYQDKNRESFSRVLELMKRCMPLFFSAFTTTYILNSSKYAIDALLENQFQVYYTVLLLPATTVHLVISFAYRPLITDYAILWEKGECRKFKKSVNIILLMIVILACLLVLMGKRFFLPIMAWLYGINELKEYAMAFNFLLIAGALNAMNVFLCFIITILRKQKHLFLIYGITFIGSLMIPKSLVKNFQINGAAFSYLVLMLIQGGGALIVYLVESRKKEK